MYPIVFTNPSIRRPAFLSHRRLHPDLRRLALLTAPEREPAAVHSYFPFYSWIFVRVDFVYSESVLFAIWSLISSTRLLIFSTRLLISSTHLLIPSTHLLIFSARLLIPSTHLLIPSTHLLIFSIRLLIFVTRWSLFDPKSTAYWLCLLTSIRRRR